MNKRRKIIFTLVFLLMLLSACGSVNNSKVKMSYGKWEKQIGLFSKKNLTTNVYILDSAEMELKLTYKNGLEGYKELCDVVNAHNKFVEDNPGYFPNGFAITFTNEYVDEMSPSFFSNISDGSNGIDYLDELAESDTSKLQYMCIKMDSVEVEVEGSEDIQIDVPIVILQSHSDSYTPKGKMYAFLKEVNNPKQIIIDYWEEGYDLNEVCKDIREYVPDVEIYKVIHVKGKDHLEKCVDTDL
ncbi:hypothetical protein D6853_07010 [Butyrivibrio sp. X503]|uniref:hypothetical protein n=1 Tax=Butyrivibrio sp. X503 TaxID=2364878 RepID=UPI000EA94BE4|nr:hypothetical protein [Butyrivibrio sp. X503]RKM56530.1 hypothetical protein D6853_07010 [Butyrivibrio sp. X503]